MPNKILFLLLLQVVEEEPRGGTINSFERKLEKFNMVDYQHQVGLCQVSISNFIWISLFRKKGLGWKCNCRICLSRCNFCPIFL